MNILLYNTSSQTVRISLSYEGQKVLGFFTGTMTVATADFVRIHHPTMNRSSFTLEYQSETSQSCQFPSHLLTILAAFHTTPCPILLLLISMPVDCYLTDMTAICLQKHPVPTTYQTDCSGQRIVILCCAEHQIRQETQSHKMSNLCCNSHPHHINNVQTVVSSHTWLYLLLTVYSCAHQLFHSVFSPLILRFFSPCPLMNGFKEFITKLSFFFLFFLLVCAPTGVCASVSGTIKYGFTVIDTSLAFNLFHYRARSITSLPLH